MTKLEDIFAPGNRKVFVIAEMSGNHCGNLQKAKSIIRAAKDAGADAVKLQTYRADTITLKTDKPDFRVSSESAWSSYSTFFELYEKAHTPWQWHEELFNYAHEVGILIFSSPFDESAVDLLEKLGAPAYKIASPEITHIPLIEKVAKLGKPVILSTGVATLEDVDLAVKTLRDNGCKQIAILKCSTEYPAPLNESHLLAIPMLKEKYKVPVGLSDHALSSIPGLVAVSVGATIVEKHFMLEKDDPSVDGFFSLDVKDMQVFITSLREVEQVLGEAKLEITPSVVKNLSARRSLYASATIKPGEVFSAQNVKCVRPSHGLHPKHFHSLIGKKAKRTLELGDRITIEDLSE